MSVRQTAAPNQMTSRTLQMPQWALFVTLGLLWGQLYYAASWIWLSSEYYSYGWFVPPLAALLFARRWRARRADRASVPVVRLVLIALLLLPTLVLLRSIAHFDPNWRPPLVAQAALVAATSHVLLAWFRGWRLSLAFLPVTIYALSAVPYPWRIEQAIIRTLTGNVMAISAEVFNFMGRPVTVVGEQLESGGVRVEVTEACSGIRSFQNLIMAALFFGELFFLSWRGRLAMIGISLAVSVIVNIWRAMTLARIRFDEGEAAFHAAHDQVGYLAYLVSALVLLGAAKLLGDAPVRRKAVKRTVSPIP